MLSCELFTDNKVNFSLNLKQNTLFEGFIIFFNKHVLFDKSNKNMVGKKHFFS